MGISILELVLRRLREANFTADVAFPGQKYPRLTEPVAAVHISRVDRSNLSVTVEVNIICPAELGGSRCELEALQATEVLRWAGATCIQNGCSYDGVAQVYVVPVSATFTGITEADNCSLGPGFSVYINNLLMPYAVSFQAEQVRENKAQYVMGETAPVGISQGSWVWNIRLEELIPGGNGETRDSAEPVQIRIESDAVSEVYYHCRWTSVRREFTREGLRRIRSGIAMMREDIIDG